MARRFRFSAVIPVVLSAVALALLVVLFQAGTKVGTGQDYYLLQLNASKIGTNLIKFTPVSQTSTVNDPTGILDGLNNILNNVTGEFDSALSDLESNLVSNLTSKLGLREVYNIYLRNICQGDYQNDNDASTAKLDTCVPYTTTADGINNSTSSIQSYVVVGTTNISVPLLETLGPSLQSLEDTIAVVGTANIIFIIIGFVANALVVIVSLLAIFLTRSRWLVRGALLFSSIAPVTVLISALFVTIIGVVVVEFVNGLGAALTIHAETGSSAVAIAWVAWAFSLAAQLYWVLTWFVSYRRSSFVRLLRTPEEVGRWRATFAQLRRDWKNPRELNKGNNRDNVPAGPESPRALIGRTEK